MTEAFLHAATGEPEPALQCLGSLLERAEVPFTGWTIPIEPLLAPVRTLPGYQQVLATLAVRAR